MMNTIDQAEMSRSRVEETEGSVAKCSFQTRKENLGVKKVSENRWFDGSR